MGPEPHAPSEALAAELRAQAGEACEEAADRLREADVLLLCTGAGFSADSGLPTYSEIAEVEAYAGRGVGYHDLCRPQVLQEEPDLFWGFWGSCFNSYRRTAPHEGFALVDAWAERRFRHSEVAGAMRKEMALLQPSGYDWVASEREPYHVSDHAGAFFAMTSNVDAHHYDCFRACEIRECHGNVELFQCAKAKASACLGVFRAPAPGFAFRVDAATRLAPPGPALEAAAATAAERPGLLRHMPAAAPGSGPMRALDGNHPRCPFCGGPARPAVLMFEDEDWQDNTSQLQRKRHWLHALLNLCGLRHADLRVVLLEIGAGGNVTTVRNSSEQILRGCLAAGAEAHLVRINPEFPLGDEDDFAPGGALRHRVVSIMGRGLESLKRIDAALAGPTEGVAGAAGASAAAGERPVSAAAAAACGADACGPEGPECPGRSGSLAVRTQ